MPVNRGILTIDDCGLSYDTSTAGQMAWASFIPTPGGAIITGASVANDSVLGRNVVYAGTYTGTIPTLVRSIGSHVTHVNGFRMRHAIATGQFGEIIRYYKGSTVECSVLLNIDNTFTFSIPATTAYNSPAIPFNLDTNWNYFEFFLTANHIGGGTFKVYINGTLFWSIGIARTTLDSDDISGIAYNGNIAMTDYYVGTGTTILGDTSVNAYFPSADLTPNTFTGTSPHWQQVNDAIPPNTIQLHSDVAADEVYSFPVVPLTTDVIFAIMPAVNAQKDVAGDVPAFYRYKNNLGADFLLGTTFGIGTTWNDNRNQVFELNPDTGQNWTRTNVNTGGFGFGRD